MNPFLSQIGSINSAPPAKIRALGPYAYYDTRFSRITSSGGRVSQIDDLSGNDRHATQGTSTNQPEIGAYTINGFRTISHGADTAGAISDAALELSTFSWDIQSQNFSAFIVFAAFEDSLNARRILTFEDASANETRIQNADAAELNTGFNWVSDKTTSEFTGNTANEDEGVYGAFSFEPINAGADANLSIWFNGAKNSSVETITGSGSLVTLQIPWRGRWDRFAWTTLVLFDRLITDAEVERMANASNGIIGGALVAT